MAVTNVVMPKLAEAMETGKLLRWLKQEGDRISGGDIIAEIETDKADIELEAFGAGVLRKLLAEPGASVPVGSLIAVIAEPDDDIGALIGDGPGAPAPASAPAPVAARALAALPAAAVPKLVRPSAEPEDLPLSQIRAAIARQMTLSKGPVPHFYVTAEVAMERAVALREELQALPGAPKVTFTDLIVRACAVTLLKHPGVNASVHGETIRRYRAVHVGIAVALDEGLITPVLRDCDQKSIFQIATEARDLVE